MGFLTQLPRASQELRWIVNSQEDNSYRNRVFPKCMWLKNPLHLWDEYSRMPTEKPRDFPRYQRGACEGNGTTSVWNSISQRWWGLVSRAQENRRQLASDDKMLVSVVSAPKDKPETRRARRVHPEVREAHKRVTRPLLTAYFLNKKLTLNLHTIRKTRVKK